MIDDRNGRRTSHTRTYRNYHTAHTSSHSSSSASSVYTLTGRRSVSALGRGLTSTTLLSGVQRPTSLTPADVDDSRLVARARTATSYERNPFATRPPEDESVSES
jgi:hypothetical protein